MSKKATIWKIPLFEYEYGDYNTPYDVQRMKKLKGPKTERTAVRLCAIADMMFVGLDTEHITDTVTVTRGVWKKRQVEEESPVKLIYYLVCKGTEEQAELIKKLKAAALVGYKYLR